MSKSIVIIDAPEKCIDCPLLNSSDECIMQDEDANFSADTFEDLRAGCPLVELPDENPSNPELKPGVYYGEFAYEIYKNGWNDLRRKLKK